MPRRVTRVTEEVPAESEYYEAMPDIYRRPVVVEDNSSRDRGIGTVAVIVAALIVLLIIGLIVARGFGTRSGGTNINVPAPSTPTTTTR